MWNCSAEGACLQWDPSPRMAFVSICDVLKYGVTPCHIHRGITVLKSTQTPLTQRSDGSQLLSCTKNRCRLLSGRSQGIQHSLRVTSRSTLSSCFVIKNLSWLKIFKMFFCFHRYIQVLLKTSSSNGAFPRTLLASAPLYSV